MRPKKAGYEWAAVGEVARHGKCHSNITSDEIIYNCFAEFSKNHSETSLFKKCNNLGDKKYTSSSNIISLR